MKKIKEVFKDKYNIAFIVILLVAVLVRIVLLDKFPNGIHEDEAGMMYDAYCMAEYGTDRYLNENPVYLINFGGGQSVLYSAIASILIRFFGLSVFVIRLPAVILSVITIILAYALAKKYIGNKFALVLSFLITICPWHIMQSRWGLDCNLLSSFIMISVFTLLNSKKELAFLSIRNIMGLNFIHICIILYHATCFLYWSMCVFTICEKNKHKTNFNYDNTNYNISNSTNIASNS